MLKRFAVFGLVLSTLVSCSLFELPTELTITNRCNFRLAFVQYPKATYTYFGSAHWYNNGIEYYGMDINEQDTHEVEPGSEYIYFYFDSPNILDFIMYRTVNSIYISKGEQYEYIFTGNTLVIERAINGEVVTEYIPVMPITGNHDLEISNYRKQR